jgi:hypothetical protein
MYSLIFLCLKTTWLESATELYHASDHHLSAKLVPTFTDRVCHVVTVTDPYGRILGSLDRLNIPCVSVSRFSYFRPLSSVYVFYRVILQSPERVCMPFSDLTLQGLSHAGWALFQSQVQSVPKRLLRH